MKYVNSEIVYVIFVSLQFVTNLLTYFIFIYLLIYSLDFRLSGLLTYIYVILLYSNLITIQHSEHILLCIHNYVYIHIVTAAT